MRRNTRDLSLRLYGVTAAMSASSLIGLGKQQAIAAPLSLAQNVRQLAPADDLRTALATLPAGYAIYLTSGEHDLSDADIALAITADAHIIGEYGCTTLVVPAGISISGGAHLRLQNLSVTSSSGPTLYCSSASVTATRCTFTSQNGLALSAYAAAIVATDSQFIRSSPDSSMGSPTVTVTGGSFVAHGTVRISGANQITTDVVSSDNLPVLQLNSAAVTSRGLLRVDGPVEITGATPAQLSFDDLLIRLGRRNRAAINLVVGAAADTFDSQGIAISQLFAQRDGKSSGVITAANVIHASVARLDDTSTGTGVVDITANGSWVAVGEIYASGDTHATGNFLGKTNITAGFRGAAFYTHGMPVPPPP